MDRGYTDLLPAETGPVRRARIAAGHVEAMREFLVGLVVAGELPASVDRKILQRVQLALRAALADEGQHGERAFTDGIAEGVRAGLAEDEEAAVRFADDVLGGGLDDGEVYP